MKKEPMKALSVRIPLEMYKGAKLLLVHREESWQTVLSLFITEFLSGRLIRDPKNPSRFQVVAQPEEKPHG